MSKGEVVVVCGPSGSGKSTLIKCVNALEPFQQGDIIIDNVSVGTKATDLPKLRARVGMVFQHFELFPHLTITDNLTLAQIKVLGRSKEEAVQKGMRLLDRVGLTAHARNTGSTVRWPATARGHCPRPVHGPDCHAFDEPTSPWIRK
jgi:glutamate/aspartate transport system ATP-binding protein